MPIYSYRCRKCGDFDASAAIDQRDAIAACPKCDGGGSRVFTPPHLRLHTRALDRAFDMAGMSGDTPSVVSSIPSSPRAPGAPVRASCYPALPTS